MLPTNILVPIDFSPTAERALDYAVALAAKLDARVHVVNAIVIPVLGVPELGVAIASTMMESLTRDHQAALDKLIESRRKLASFGEVMLQTGDPRDMILTTAAIVKADLIVMGTHGRRGLTRALLGSVAEMIIRAAPCPVLTIRAVKP